MLRLTLTYWLARKYARLSVPRSLSGTSVKLLASVCSSTFAIFTCWTAGCRLFARRLALNSDTGRSSGAAAMRLLRTDTMERKPEREIFFISLLS